jgi:hypothetical protein
MNKNKLRLPAILSKEAAYSTSEKHEYARYGMIPSTKLNWAGVHSYSLYEVRKCFLLSFAIRHLSEGYLPYINYRDNIHAVAYNRPILYSSQLQLLLNYAIYK